MFCASTLLCCPNLRNTVGSCKTKFSYFHYKLEVRSQFKKINFHYFGPCIDKCLHQTVEVRRIQIAIGVFYGKYYFYLFLAYVGLAALCLMGKERLCNTENLLLWTANRQMRLEGGFQVRAS
jgi:hypothetical protein